MLVLSRKTGETVVIEGGIEVTVLEVRGSKVRLGFKVPDDVGVAREEVVRSIGMEQFLETRRAERIAS